jgi:hypothetical protein
MFFPQTEKPRRNEWRRDAHVEVPIMNEFNMFYAYKKDQLGWTLKVEEAGSSETSATT